MTSNAYVRATRICATLGLLIELFMLSGLPFWPQTWEERSAFVTLVLLVVGGLFVIVRVRVQPRAAALLQGILAAYGTFVTIKLVLTIRMLNAGTMTPSLSLSYLLAFALAACLILAFAAAWRANGLIQQARAS